MHPHENVLVLKSSKRGTRNPSERDLQFRILNCTVVQYKNTNRLDIRVIALLLSPLCQLLYSALTRTIFGSLGTIKVLLPSYPVNKCIIYHIIMCLVWGARLKFSKKEKPCVSMHNYVKQNL